MTDTYRNTWQYMPALEAVMKKTIGICLFIVALTATAAGSWLFWDNLSKSKPIESRMLLATEESTEGMPVTAEIMKILEPYRYILQEKDGVLIVYEHDGQTIRMETGIRTHGLDEGTRLLLRQGIHVKNDEELYTLLESYSS